jgi:hypothetical protein
MGRLHAMVITEMRQMIGRMTIAFEKDRIVEGIRRDRFATMDDILECYLSSKWNFVTNNERITPSKTLSDLRLR